MKAKQNKTQKRIVRFSLYTAALYLALITLSLSGVTFSKYIKSTVTGDEARMAYMREIAVTERGNFAATGKALIAPGMDIVKDMTVSFDSGEMACYVFLEIKARGWNRLSGYRYAISARGASALSFEIESDWLYLTGDESGAVYYRIVSANTNLSAKIIAEDGKIAVSENITKTRIERLPADLSIEAVATAAQYHGFDETLDSGYTEEERAAAAWNILKRNR